MKTTRVTQLECGLTVLSLAALMAATAVNTNNGRGDGWETVVGLEIHAQLATKSKIFSGSATAYGAPPNTQASLVDLAYPGVLPVLNAEVVRMAVKFGLAVGATKVITVTFSATSVPSDAAISDARDSRKSPARIAWRLPHLALTVSTPRRVVASSITSS